MPSWQSLLGVVVVAEKTDEKPGHRAQYVAHKVAPEDETCLNAS